MAAVSTLVKDILSDIPEVPSFVAQRQYLRALRELCEKARVWRADTTITTIPNEETLDIDSQLPDNTELVDVISLLPPDGNSSVKPKTQAWMDLNQADWRTQTGQYANYYMLNTNNTLQLVPIPTGAVTYYLRAAVKPTLSCTDIAEIIVNKYSELIISGAKAYLFMTPRKPWTDLQLAQYHQAAFLGGIPNARTEAADEYQTGVARKVKYGGL